MLPKILQQPTSHSSPFCHSPHTHNSITTHHTLGVPTSIALHNNPPQNTLPLPPPFPHPGSRSRGRREARQFQAGGRCRLLCNNSLSIHTVCPVVEEGVWWMSGVVKEWCGGRRGGRRKSVVEKGVGEEGVWRKKAWWKKGCSGRRKGVVGEGRV